MNHNAADLIHYSAGQRAQTALAATFTQVAEELESGSDGRSYFSRASSKGASWPSLRIGAESWAGIFGSAGCHPVVLWFVIHGVWGATEHGFAFEVELFSTDTEVEWQALLPRLSGWFSVIKEDARNQIWVRLDNNTEIEITSVEQITKRPLRLYVCTKDLFLEEEALGQLSSEALIQMLVAEARRFARVIDRFV